MRQEISFARIHYDAERKATRRGRLLAEMQPIRVGLGRWSAADWSRVGVADVLARAVFGLADEVPDRYPRPTIAPHASTSGRQSIRPWRFADALRIRSIVRRGRRSRRCKHVHSPHRARNFSATRGRRLGVGNCRETPARLASAEGLDAEPRRRGGGQRLSARSRH
jgi:hypothetical protein